MVQSLNEPPAFVRAAASEPLPGTTALRIPPPQYNSSSVVSAENPLPRSSNARGTSKKGQALVPLQPTDSSNNNNNNSNKAPTKQQQQTNVGRLCCTGHLIAEDDEGDVEYKWRLTGITAARFEHLKTQMRFRVAEGNGRCLYEIGVADDGLPRGLTPEDYEESVDTVRRLASSLGFHVSVVYERTVTSTPVLLRCAELMVLQTLQPADTVDLRIAFCGNTGCGKSTLVSVLVHGELDDGQGFARQGMFNHKHELDSGRTSSVAAKVLGFDETGKVTNYDAQEDDAEGGDSSPAVFYGGSTLSAMENNTRTIASRSVKLVTLMDLGGDSRYSKTTLFGFTSRMPGYACICVAANSETVQAESEPYIALCAGMRIPFFIVLTKSDAVSEIEMDDALFEISSVVEQRCGIGSELAPVSPDASVAEVMEVIGRLRSSADGSSFPTQQQSTVPVLTMSSVDGSGMKQLKAFLHGLPMPDPPHVSPRAGVEILLDTAFSVSGVGLVLGGFLTRGRVRTGDVLFLGPDRNGLFLPVTVEGLHVKGCHVMEATSGMEVSVALGSQLMIPSSLDVHRKGNILVDVPHELQQGDAAAGGVVMRVCYGFEAQVEVLTADTVKVGQEPVVHCRNIRQAARITSIAATTTETALLTPAEPVSDEDSGGRGNTSFPIQPLTAGGHSPSPLMMLRQREVGLIECKFLYNAEVLDVGSVVVMRWSRDAKLIGRVTKLLPLSHAATPVMGPATTKRQPSPPILDA